MDSIRETTIDLLEKFLFQLNLLFDLENSTAYLVLKPFFRNIAEDPLVFLVTLSALFLIPYIMIRVRRNTVTQGKKAEKLLSELETERSIEIPEEELELPEPESALYDKTSEPIFEEGKIVEVEDKASETDEAGDPELEFLKDLDLDSMYTKSYSIEETPEERAPEENPTHGEEPEISTAEDTVEDFSGSWKFPEEVGPDEPVITQLTEEKPADFEDALREYTETANIEEPSAEDDSGESLDRVNTIDELTRQMEATIENISNQIIEEDIDDSKTAPIPPEVMDFDEEGSSAATFDSEFSAKEEPDSLADDEGPAITTPIPLQETNESPLENADAYEPENPSYTFSYEDSNYPEETDEREVEDTGLNKLFGLPIEETEDDVSESISAMTSEEETVESTDNNDSTPSFPENLKRSEILTAAETVEDPEPRISEPAESATTAEPESSDTEINTPEPEKRGMENGENKTKLLVERLENFQKHLEKRLTALELTLEKRKTGHES
jgi:hypothetical protein